MRTCHANSTRTVMVPAQGISHHFVSMEHQEKHMKKQQIVTLMEMVPAANFKQFHHLHFIPRIHILLLSMNKINGELNCKWSIRIRIEFKLHL